MNKIHSVCTVAIENDWNDLQLLLYSISVYNPFIPIYLSANHNLISLLEQSELSDGRIQIKVITASQMQNKKDTICELINIALSYSANTIFVSPNTVIIKHLDVSNFVSQEVNVGNTSVIVPNTQILNLDTMIILKDTFADWFKENTPTSVENMFNRTAVMQTSSYSDWQYYDASSSDKVAVVKTYFDKSYTKDVFVSKYIKFVVDTFFRNIEHPFSKIVMDVYKKCEFELCDQNTHNNGNSSGGGLNLLVQYVQDANTERQEEYDFCFEANLSNPHVDVMYNFKFRDVLVPDSIKNHPKYREIQLFTPALKYNDAFNFANQELKEKLTCLIKSDIFLDHKSNWKIADDVAKQNITLCLSSFEFDGNVAKKGEKAEMMKFCDKQDGWVFKSPLPSTHQVEIGELNVNDTFSNLEVSYFLNKGGNVLLNNQNEFKLYRYERTPKENESVVPKQYRLLPDIDSFITQNDSKLDVSIDAAAKYLGLGIIQKYTTICDMFSNHIKLI